MRILIIDDHAIFRGGLKRLLADLLGDLDADVEFSEAASCEQALAMAPQPFDLVLLDLNMPGRAGIPGLLAMREAFDSSPIVVLSGEDKPQLVRETIIARAAGFIPKSSTPEVLSGALRLILAKGVYLPELALCDIKVGAPAPEAKINGEQLSAALSPKQIEVLRHAVEGKANKVIARELGIAEGTVKAHLAAAFRALRVKNRTEAVYAAARSGLQFKA